MKFIWTCLALLMCAGWTPAQEQRSVDLPARVLSVTESLVELDRGSLDGVEPGDWVRLQPLIGGEVSAQVERVEEHSCWIRLKRAAADSGIEAGVACEIKITTEVSKDDKPAGSGFGPGVPTTAPQWKRPQGEWDMQRPLLAEDPLQPDERDSMWSGRFYSAFHSSQENENDGSTSTFARAGLDLRGDNPFGIGGRLRLSLDLDHRSYSSDSGADDSNFHGRVDRLSYAHGGDRFHPLRWEVGRFVSDLFPEFGVIDGAELRYRLPSGLLVGGSLGFQPEPSADYETGEDLQLAAYFQSVHGEQRSVRWGGGVQKTWHDGEADRDLMILKFDYVPDTQFRFHSSAWIDFYDSKDSGKSDGAELTTAQARAYWRKDDYGASVGYRQWRYPQLLRYQAGSFTNTELLNENTSRTDLRLWGDWTSSLRLSGRLDHWQSDDDSGGGIELRMDWYDWLGPEFDTSVQLYSRQGSYIDATGIRLDQFLGLDSGGLRATWESSRYTPSDGDGEDLLEHDLRLSWDYWSNDGWSLNLDGGIRFGDHLNNPYLGMYLQRSF